MSIRVLVIFPFVGDGGNFPAYPGLQSLQWTARSQLAEVLPQGPTRPSPSAFPKQESSLGSLHPSQSPFHRRLAMLLPLHLPAGYRECFPLPGLLRTLAAQNSRKVLSCRPVMAQVSGASHCFASCCLYSFTFSHDLRGCQAPLAPPTLSLRCCPKLVWALSLLPHQVPRVPFWLSCSAWKKGQE